MKKIKIILLLLKGATELFKAAKYLINRKKKSKLKAMKEEKIGIETTSKIILFGIKLGEGIDKRLADDGKISVWEGITLVPVLKDLPAIIRDRKTLVPELKDLSSDELDQIENLIMVELQLGKDKVKNIVLKGINVVIAVKELIDAIREPGDEAEDFNPDNGFKK